MNFWYKSQLLDVESIKSKIDRSGKDVDSVYMYPEPLLYSDVEEYIILLV